MEVRVAIAACLTALPGCSCWSWTAPTDPGPDGLFSAELSEAELAELAATLGLEDPADVPCETACVAAQPDSYGDYQGQVWLRSEDDVHDCTLTPIEPDTAAPPVGVYLTCQGPTFFFLSCEGRRPWSCPPIGGGDLAGLAALEALSVVAFEELALQLVAHGAPEALIARCRAAADDERRHARWIGLLAGAEPPLPAAGVSADLDLEALATHNAVEGCVHETWSALGAHVRAARATHAVVRAVYARIAVDETRHGQLAWDLHAWLLGQLDADAAARVRTAQAEALAALPEVAFAQRLPPLLGHPSGPEARHLAADLARRLAA